MLIKKAEPSCVGLISCVISLCKPVTNNVANIQCDDQALSPASNNDLPLDDYLCHGSCTTASAALYLSALESAISIGRLDFLQLLINGRRLYGLLDNQASFNFITEDFAIENNVEIEYESDVVTVGDSRTTRLVGRGRLLCIALLETKKVVECEFKILRSATRSIILGRPFLRSISCHCRASSEANDSLLSVSRELGNGYCLTSHVDLRLRVRFRRNLSEKEVLAVIDWGASANLLSLDIATLLGLSISRHLKQQATILLGDGRRIRSVGVVCLTVLFVRRDGGSKRVSLKFNVVHDLAFGMVFGTSTLQNLKQWSDGDIILEWVPIFEPRILLCTYEVNKGIVP